jgi:CheY-like chemotaxis protein
VLNSAERTARISQQLLAFTRQQVTQPAILDFAELVVQLTPVLQQLLGTDKALVIPAPLIPLPRVAADRDQVEQVLINLVANARDATDTGARVTLSLAEVTLHAELPAPPGDPVVPGHYVRLAVTDTGYGMSPATLERIFDPFFTTKDVGKGTGLGLSMVYGTLRRHGGYVRAQSAPSLGTTMELYWPVAAASSAGDGQLGSGVPDSSTGAAGMVAASALAPEPRAVVLLVEDEPTVRAVTARSLAADGHEVVEAGDGAAALAMLERGEVRPDLIVTDVIMPHLNGRQLHDVVRVRWPQVPVLYISGHTGEAVVRERLVPAGAAFLGKPFTPDALQRAARELLRAAAERGSTAS